MALRHINDGFDILEIGAETTRPGSKPISQEDEWDRLKPVLSALSRIKDLPPISIDTYRAETAQMAIDAGASIINDIYAGLFDPDIFKVTAKNKVPLVLMHMQGTPNTMQIDPHYDDVIKEVRDFLHERALEAERCGVERSKIILDPGIGFGKNLTHNLTILKRFKEVIPKGYHSLMALSRKAFLGQILGTSPTERDFASAVASSLAVLEGAEIVRVHNVPPTREALLVTRKFMEVN
jgi:dihydropteroate synthase